MWRHVMKEHTNASNHWIDVNGNITYCMSGIFCIGKFWRKQCLEGVLNFHRVLFSLFQGLLMKTYNRVYFSLRLFFAISVRSWTQRKLNPREKFPIYGIILSKIKKKMRSKVQIKFGILPIRMSPFSLCSPCFTPGHVTLVLPLSNLGRIYSIICWKVTHPMFL